MATAPTHHGWQVKPGDHPWLRPVPSPPHQSHTSQTSIVIMGLVSL